MPVEVSAQSFVQTMTVQHYLLVCCILYVASGIPSVTPTMENATVESILDNATVESTLENATVESILENATVESTLENATVESTLDNATVESTLDNATVESTLDNATVESILDNATVESTLENATVESILDNATVESTMENATVNPPTTDNITVIDGGRRRPNPVISDIPTVVEEPMCDSCSVRNSTQCLAEEYPGCKCDALCQVYDDCCVDPAPSCEPPLSYTKVATPISLLFTYMECNTLYHELFASNSQETYWMVSRCPQGLINVELYIYEQCTAGSTAPVSDERTGIIYKNEYCAACHSVTFITRWSSSYTCREEFKELLGTQTIDLDTFLANCTFCQYVIPTSLYNNSAIEVIPPRSCLIHTSDCPEYEDYLLNSIEEEMLVFEQFENAVYHCIYGPYSPILGSQFVNGNFLGFLYKNAHCALCNGATVQEFSQCPLFSDSNVCSLSLNQLGNKFNVKPTSTFNLLLDINRDGGTTTISTETIASTTELQTRCDVNSVFDPVTQRCREIVCPPKFIASKGQCVKPPTRAIPDQFELGHEDEVNNSRVFDNSVAEKNSITSPETPSDPHVSTLSIEDTVPTNSTCFLVTLIEGQDNFTSIGNDSLIFEGIVFTIIAFDDSQNPVICYPFSDALTVSHHQKIKQIVPGLFIAPSLTIALVAIALQLSLRKLHSLYTVVIINLALALLLNDVFLLSTFSSVTSLGVIHFLWHSCSLAVASGLCVLVVHFNLSFRKRCKHSSTASLNLSQKVTLVGLYLTSGWGLPLLIALVKNELYGAWRPCLNNPFGLCGPIISTAAFFITPILMAVVFCLLISLYIFTTVVMPPCPLDKQILRRFYIFLVLLFTFALEWIFGFIYLLSPSQLIATVGFFAFLILKLVYVLLFFFGFVLTKRLREALHDLLFNSNPKNRVHPLSLPEKEQISPDVTLAEPATSSIIISHKKISV